MSDNNNKYKNWEIFAKQSEFFWRFQQIVAFVEIGLFTGWYKLYQDKELILATGLLILGVFVLFILFLIIKRASQYLNALREPALEDLSNKLPPPTLGLKTNVIGVWIPISLIIFNILLLIFTVLKLGG